MDDNAVFQWTKLFLDAFPPLPILLLLGCIMLLLNDKFMKLLQKSVSKIVVGNFQIELREIEEQLAATRSELRAVESDLENRNQQLAEILQSFDPHGPVQELGPVRNQLRAFASTTSDVSDAIKGLEPGASHSEIYVAAEVLRARRDPQYFDALVACIKRLAAAPQMEGVRRHTVWALASALHRTLIADFQSGALAQLDRKQLENARDALDMLVIHPRVLTDRPDQPEKGIRGPATWARQWIEKSLGRIDRS
ncbi:MAG TPA: hypothetical protein DEF16_13150 [Gemmobacter sp.]|nr:MAG: hypothetical protein A2X69_18455 [Rhodobacteraceae bacterium GWF1_65_7]HBD92081.1 hypothetical protein [Gemmobacter sp.]HBU15628.1 hypothetical protein [Gemmobacter sp.]